MSEYSCGKCDPLPQKGDEKFKEAQQRGLDCLKKLQYGIATKNNTTNEILKKQFGIGVDDSEISEISYNLATIENQIMNLKPCAMEQKNKDEKGNEIVPPEKDCPPLPADKELPKRNASSRMCNPKHLYNYWKGFWTGGNPLSHSNEIDIPEGFYDDSKPIDERAKDLIHESGHSGMDNTGFRHEGREVYNKGNSGYWDKCGFFHPLLPNKSEKMDMMDNYSQAAMENCQNMEIEDDWAYEHFLKHGDSGESESGPW